MARARKKRYTVGTGRRKVMSTRGRTRGHSSIWKFFTGGKLTRRSGTLWGFTPRRSSQYRGGWTLPRNR